MMLRHSFLSVLMLTILTLNNSEEIFLQTEHLANSTLQASILNKLSGQLAFVSDRDGNREIYLLNADDLDSVNLTNNPASDHSPAWSPDGRQLAFVSDRDGYPQIYVMNADGSGVRQLTNIGFDESNAVPLEELIVPGDDRVINDGPVWSPDGRHIAFYSQRDYFDSISIYWTDIEGNQLAEVYSAPGYGGRISWSADSQQLIFNNNPSGSFNLFKVDLAGNVVQYSPRSTEWDHPYPPDGGWWDLVPAWSPDGRSIAFQSGRWQRNNDVYVADVDGRNVVSLSAPFNYSYAPVWSPDSQWVAFMSQGGGLYIVQPDASDFRKLSDLTAIGVKAQWSWSPYSSELAFAVPPSAESDQRDIFIIDIDGEGLVNLTNHPAEDSNPVWRPIALDVDPGLIAYYNIDGHVWLVGSDGNDARLVTGEGAPTGNFYDHAIRWSPDGRQLAFVRGGYPGSPEEETLLVYDVQSSTLTPLLNVHDLIGFDWSPDSKSLVYSFEGSLWQVNVQSAKTSELVVPERGYPLVEPHWAPGGQYLGFAESVVGEGSGLFAIYSPAEQDYQAYDSSLGQYSWSPDGSSLIYDGIVYVEPGEGLSRLSLPSSVEQLTWPGAGVTDAAPVMTTDGSQIAFLRSASEEGPHYPWVMNSDGSDQRQVADLPVRSVLQSLSWSPDSSVLAIGSAAQEETAIFLVDSQSGETQWLASGSSPAWQPRPAAIEEVEEPGCGTWRWKEVSGEDDRIELSPISEDSWEDCRGAFRLSNKTDFYRFGGYALELTTSLDTADVEMVPPADPDGRSYLLPPLNSEIHVTPHNIDSEANVFISGEMTGSSFVIDLSLFALRAGLAIIPGTGCVISEEQLLFTALRTHDILDTAAELTLEGDFVAAKDELLQVLPEFYKKAGDVLADIGVECGIDLVQAILKKPLHIVKVGVAYLTWVPVVISDYFKHEGRPIRITLTYSEATLTQEGLRKTSFRLPGDGIKNNNESIGPFCCTGETATVLHRDGYPAGYIYFYSWDGQAYNVGDNRSIAPNIEILVSGLADLSDPTSSQQQSTIRFPTATMIPRETLSSQAGSLYFTVTIEEATLESYSGDLFFDMGSVVITVDVSG